MKKFIYLFVCLFVCLFVYNKKAVSATRSLDVRGVDTVLTNVHIEFHNRSDTDFINDLQSLSSEYIEPINSNTSIFNNIVKEKLEPAGLKVFTSRFYSSSVQYRETVKQGGILNFDLVLTFFNGKEFGEDNSNKNFVTVYGIKQRVFNTNEREPLFFYPKIKTYMFDYEKTNPEEFVNKLRKILEEKIVFHSTLLFCRRIDNEHCEKERSKVIDPLKGSALER